MKRTAHWRWTLVAIWTVAFVGALAADGPIARWVRASGTAAAVDRSRWAPWVKAPGTFWFTVAVLGALWLARRIDWRRTLVALAVAAFAGLNVVLKWVAGRYRPFKLPEPLTTQPRPFALHPFWHGPAGLFVQKNLCFPSGHESTAMGLAAAAWLVYRPAAWPLLALAAAVGVERVVENAHYVSDVVGAVGLAWFGAAVVKRLLWPWATRVPNIARIDEALTAGSKPG